MIKIQVDPPLWPELEISLPFLTNFTTVWHKILTRENIDEFEAIRQNFSIQIQLFVCKANPIRQIFTCQIFS